MKTNDGYVIRRRVKYYIMCNYSTPIISEATCSAIREGHPHFNRSPELSSMTSLSDLNGDGYFVFAKRKNAVKKLRNIVRYRISNATQEYKSLLKDLQGILRIQKHHENN